MSMRTPVKPCEILLAGDSSADLELVRRAPQQSSVHCKLHVLRGGAEAIQWIERRDADPKALSKVYFKSETGTLPARRPRKAERARGIAA